MNKDLCEATAQKVRALGRKAIPAAIDVTNREQVQNMVDKAMAERAAPSKNVLVERALVKELKELRRQARQAQWEAGAKDPALLKDICNTESAFKSADAETAN